MGLRVGLFVGRLSAAAACMCFISAQANADEVLKRAYVVTETLNDDAAKCGLSADLLQSHAEKVLQTNNVAISHNEHEDIVTAYVNVTVVRESDNYCGANVDVQFYSSGYEEIPGTDFVEASKIVYCNKGTLLLGGTDHLEARVVEAVEGSAAQCVSQIAKKVAKRGPAG